MHYPSYVLIFQIFFIIWNMGSTCTPLNSDFGQFKKTKKKKKTHTSIISP